MKKPKVSTKKSKSKKVTKEPVKAAHVEEVAPAAPVAEIPATPHN